MDPEFIFKKIVEEWESENRNDDKVIDLYTEYINTGAEAYMIDILKNRATKYYYYRNDLDKAMDDYNKALELSIKNNEYADILDIYNGIGEIYFDLKNYDKAIKEFNNALNIYNSLFKSGSDQKRETLKLPIFVTYFCLGNIYYKTRNYLLALENYNKGEMNYTYEEGLYIGRGLCYLKLNKLNLAVEDFDKVIIDSIYEQNSVYNNFRNNEAYFKRSIVDYTKIINKNNSGDSFLNKYYRGVYYFRLKEYELAIEDFDDTIELNQFFIPSYFFRGLSYLFLNKYKLYVENFDKVISYFPEYKDKYTKNEIECSKHENISLKDVYNYRGVGYYEIKNYEESLLNYLTSIDIFLNFILEKGGFAYQETEISNQIKLQNKRINEFDSKQYTIWNINFDIGKKLEMAIVNNLNLYDYKENFEDYLNSLWGLKYFKLNLIDYCIKFYPDNSKVYIYRALKNFQLENYLEALNDCKIATDLNPLMKEGYHNAAVAYYKLEKYSDSLFQINRALEISNKDYKYYFTRGLIFLKLNKYPQSLIDFNTSIELNQDIADVYLGRAHAHIKLKNINAGIEDLKKVLSLESSMSEDVENLCKAEKIPFPFFQVEKGRSRIIPSSVRDAVWRRAGGRCEGEGCDSNENLEFDHIIPFSKGGANTYRNIQLLCVTCNRKKYNNIG